MPALGMLGFKPKSDSTRTSIVPRVKRKSLLPPNETSSGIDYDDPVPLDSTDDDEFAEQEFDKAGPSKPKGGKGKAPVSKTKSEDGDGKKRGRPKKDAGSDQAGGPSVKRRKSEGKGKEREEGLKQTKLVHDRAEESSSDDGGFDLKKAGRKKSLRHKHTAPYKNPLELLAGNLFSSDSEPDEKVDSPFRPTSTSKSPPIASSSSTSANAKKVSVDDSETESGSATEEDPYAPSDDDDPDAWKKEQAKKLAAAKKDKELMEDSDEEDPLFSWKSQPVRKKVPSPVAEAKKVELDTTPEALELARKRLNDAKPVSDELPAEGPVMVPPKTGTRPAFPCSAAQADIGPSVLRHPSATDPDVIQIPAAINRFLRAYQVQGVQFFWERYQAGKGGILGDDMGLGKTVQVIAFLSAIMLKTGTARDERRRYKRIESLKAQGLQFEGIDARNPKANAKWPTCLIIAPSSVCFNWEREIKRWGYFEVAVYAGSEKRQVLSEFNAGHYDILIASYSTASNQASDLHDLDFSCIIADEVHTIKTVTATTTKNLSRYKCPVRFGLTGTAIQNRSEEFWSILDWARRGEVGTLNEWKAFVADPIKNGQKSDASVTELVHGRLKAIVLVKKILPHFFLRRTKALIADEMPKKRDLVVLCRMEPQQAECLRNIRVCEDVQLIITKDDPCDCGQNEPPKRRIKCCYGENSAGTPIMTLTFKYLSIYRKLANHVALIYPCDDDTPEQKLVNEEVVKLAYPNHVNEPPKRYAIDSLDSKLCCGKWEATRLLAAWRPNNQPSTNKVLIFSESVKLLRIIEFFINLEGYGYRFLHGGIPGKDRMGMVDEFQTDPNVYIFLISTKTGGVGLNLTAANKVIIFDPSWNPASDLQAMDRAYRMGQEKDVEVYRLVSAGSIEENMLARQMYKRQVSSIGYNATFERRLFKGVMGDRRQQGELFGVKNLFDIDDSDTLTNDAIVGLAAMEFQFTSLDNDEVAALDVKQEEESMEDFLQDEPSKPEPVSQDDIMRSYLEQAGASDFATDDQFIGNSELERKIFEQAKELFKAKGAKGTLGMSAYEAALSAPRKPPVKKVKKEDAADDGPPEMDFKPPPRTQKPKSL